MKYLLLLTILSSLSFGQGIGGKAGVGGKAGIGGSLTAGASPIVKDGSVTCSATSSGTLSLSCGNLTSVTAGDLIWCTFGVDGTGSGNGFLTVSDATNGRYYVPQYANVNGGAFLNISSQGQAYFPNAAGGTYAPTVTDSVSNFMSISCTAFMNARSTFVLDNGVINQSKDQSSTATNPTSGSTQTPTTNGELVTCMLTDVTKTPIAGGGYTLVSGIAANQEWPEYQIQTTATATNCPYTMTTDTWRDGMTAFLPSAAAAGSTPRGAVLVTFEGVSNGSAVTAGMMNTGSMTGCPTGVWTSSNSAFTGSTSGQKALTQATYICNGSSTTTGTGTLGVQWSTSGTPPGGATYTLAGFTPHFSSGIWMCPSFDSTGDSTSSYDTDQIGSDGGNADFIIAQIHNGVIRLEAVGGTTAGVTISGSTCYWVTMQYNSAGTHHMSVYTDCTLGTQVGTDQTEAATGTHNAQSFGVGIFGAESEVAAQTIRWDNAILDPYTAQYPLGCT